MCDDEDDFDNTLPDGQKDTEHHTRLKSPGTVISNERCIICEKKSIKQVKKLIRLESENRVDSLKEAAISVNDVDLLARLNSSDLFAADAAYHNVCMSSILKKAKRLFPLEPEVKDHVIDEAFSKFIDVIDVDLTQGTVFKMSSLLDKFKYFLPNTSHYENYQCRYLQPKLQKHYGDKIVIVERKGQGKSNLVHSKTVKLDAALDTAATLKSDLQVVNFEDTFDVEMKSEEQVIYEAASILKHEIEDFKKDYDNDTYFDCDDLSLEASENFVPPLLLKFMTTILDVNKSSDKDTAVKNVNKKRIALALSECLIYNSSRIITPFVFGIGVQLHHDYGKRAIIDCLHAHGLCVSYTELRQFLTSLAFSESTHVEDGIYIPSKITHINQGGMLIQEGDDNVDINTETIDGKNTFHSMARVVFQKQTVKPKQERRIRKIKASSMASLDKKFSDITNVTTVYQPNKKPEPPKRDKPFELIELSKITNTNLKEISWGMLRMVSRQCLLLPNEVTILPFYKLHYDFILDPLYVFIVYMCIYIYDYMFLTLI